MDADKLVKLVNAHVAENKPHNETKRCIITPINRRLHTLMLPSYYAAKDQAAKPKDILTSDEEDAEVGRLWGIDASRVEFGE